MRRRLIGSILFAALSVAPGAVRADGAAGASPRPTAAIVERQKQRLDLERQLERINAEIDALKREKRGFGDDYRLRARMADAEALARRLNDLDALMGNTGHAAPGRTDTVWASPPVASPSDDRADLEAKADILSDQSRRLNSQADVLSLRVADLRRRQELRRRAGQLERDPFSPLEQAKRRVATTAALGGGAKDTAGGGRTTFGSADSPSTPGSVPTPTSGQGPTLSGAGAPPPGTGVTGVEVAPRGPTNTVGSIPAPTPSPIPGPSEAPGSVAAQFRGVLDTATLAEIRKLEVPGSSAGTLPAMERALSALRGRATQLEANANTLRKRAQTAR